MIRTSELPVVHPVDVVPGLFIDDDPILEVDHGHVTTFEGRHLLVSDVLKARRRGRVKLYTGRLEPGDVIQLASGKAYFVSRSAPSTRVVCTEVGSFNKPPKIFDQQDLDQLFRDGIARAIVPVY